jgi:hypothetical protein
MTSPARDPRRTPLAKAAGFVDYRGTKTADNPLLNPPKEPWVIVAYRGGQSIHLSPEFFPICRSRDECRDRALDRVKRDPDFVKLFRGHRLLYLRIDDCVEIR